MKRSRISIYKPQEEAPKKPKRSDAFQLSDSVRDWVLSHCRTEYVYGRTKKEQDVRYFYKGTKRSFAEGFARHHAMENNKPIFNPSGTSDSSTPAETTFKKHWPKDVERAKWWECVCLKCEVVDLALQDLLDLIKAAHKGSDYQKHVHGVVGQCQNTECYWYKQAAKKKLPTGTSNCASYCLSQAESKKHCVPFLLCRECKCQNPDSPQQDAECHFRNGKPCKSDGTVCCGGKNFPICEFLASTQTKHNANNVTSVRRNGNRIHNVSQELKTYNEIHMNFVDRFDSFIEHGLGDMHSKMAKVRLLNEVESDHTTDAIFVDWSQMLSLKQLKTAVAPTHIKLGVMVGILVSSKDNKLRAETVVGGSDGADNTNRATLLYLIKLLRKIKREQPWVTLGYQSCFVQ